MIDRLPDGWNVVQIGQVADLINGYSQFNNKSYVDDGIPIFRIGDLGGLINLSGVKRVSQNIVPNLNQKRLFRGDILIAKIGKRAGASSVYNFDEPAILSSQVAGVRAKGIDQKFLAYVIQSSFFYNAIKPYFFGSTRDNISTNQIGLTSIPFPSCLIQQKIAAILSPYDDLIENNTRRIQILEEMAQIIYRQWFVEFKFPGHEEVKMVESELGMIPQGWEVVKCADILDLSRKGITPSKYPEEIFTHFSMPAFDRGCTPTLESGNAIKSNKYLVPGECVLVSKLNPHIPRVWFPFLDPMRRAIASTEFLILKPKPPANCVFLFHLYRSPEFTGRFAVRALGTSHSHQRVSPTDFLGLSVLIPTESLLNSFHEKISPMLNFCNTLRLKNVNLRKTRDLLLPKLISGELDVSELDINIDSIQPTVRNDSNSASVDSTVAH